MKNHNVEVLAPAGSYDIMKAVINAGADAVYLGGDMFGARAYAGNLNKEEMIRALDYAHLRDKKIYLTVNTLLKENECTHELVDYIAPFYEAGLDACIVQDMGVFKILHSAFPDMHMHASTQMTITGEKGASILKEMGAMRIVTARELTLDEIRQIHEKCDIEIESFVHGALCYCYSGQCLLSSMNGTRSGNRGRCAQACRLDYSVVNNDKVINDSKSSYPLSPKDMCALDILPDIIDAGVYSMKIEGRMKNVTYAAGVTSIYRKYTDMYLENGRKGYHVSQEDKNMLLDIFNRGSFTSGYYNSEKGKNMMSLSRPNHMGVKALQVVKNDNGRILFKALTDINPQDVFEIDSDNAYTSGDSYKKGSTFTVNLSRKLPLYKDRIIYRMKNGSVTKEIAEKLLAGADEVKVKPEYFIQDIKYYLAAKKMMDIYDCNAFSTACHELCTTEIPQNRKFTPCMCHSIMKDEGIPSGCEEDLNALMAMLIMQYAANRPAFMGNPNHETDELLRIHHAVPALCMNGYGTKPLEYKLWAFTGQGFGGKLQVDFTQNEDDYITLGRFNPAGDTMCIKKGKVIRSEYAETYCSPYYYIQMDDAREFMHNLAGFGHHQVLIFGDYTRLIKKIAKVMDFNILEG